MQDKNTKPSIINTPEGMKKLPWEHTVPYKGVPYSRPLQSSCGGGWSWVLLPWQQVSMWNNSCGTECYGVLGPLPSSSPPPPPPALFMSRPSLQCKPPAHSYSAMTNKTVGPSRPRRLPDWLAGGGPACVCMCAHTQGDVLHNRLGFPLLEGGKEGACGHFVTWLFVSAFFQTRPPLPTPQSLDVEICQAHTCAVIFGMLPLKQVHMLALQLLVVCVYLM